MFDLCCTMIAKKSSPNRNFCLLKPRVSMMMSMMIINVIFIMIFLMVFMMIFMMMSKLRIAHDLVTFSLPLETFRTQQPRLTHTHKDIDYYCAMPGIPCNGINFAQNQKATSEYIVIHLFYSFLISSPIC